ncbi:MAG TPA: bifunctional DNA-formamidopyrimidine glycosylase/DNA-(apurinic or apyrimidinic site) lyase [Candidatus Saccharimonadales bacterium]|nr:bifunctional DNA-formamidopyrimidine glycosylase/DNA-(apurinic or apyrimidinic site) lyase [Candidatus Saccharimonadales bacterium]
MPELPEVETVRRGLEKLIVGQKITVVDFDWPKSFQAAPDDVQQFLIGAHVSAVSRRAKVLIIDLDSDYSLVIHLKMTGQLVFVAAAPGEPASVSETRQFKGSKLPMAESQVSSTNTGSPKRFGGGHPNGSLTGRLPDKSTRVSFGFEAGGRLFFNDQRKFGWVKLLPTPEVMNIDFMKRVGPEPLSSDFTADQFVERFARRPNTTIKAALLDQSVVAGVGNIYADEALWGALIHPATRVKDVPGIKLKSLYDELRYVLNLSIDKGGSTDRNYVDAEGKKGSYLEFARVFRREGLPCPRCGAIIEKLRVAGRGTHICPEEQRL